VLYVHASNNSGQRDEHIGLEDGTLDWRHVLDMLDFSKIVKIIIEVRHTDMVEASTTALMRYLDQDLLARKYRAFG
jgi:sugar phosphate isomerase/epimerase